METKLTSLIRYSLLTLLAVVIVGLMLIFKTTSIPLGSVTVGNEYKSSNAILLTASNTAATLLKYGPATLGSVVLPIASTQTITLYDVAVGANYGSTTLSTKIVELATSTPAGTYTFDLQTNRGLAAFMPVASTKEIIITYR